MKTYTKCAVITILVALAGPSWPPACAGNGDAPPATADLVLDLQEGSIDGIAVGAARSLVQARWGSGHVSNLIVLRDGSEEKDLKYSHLGVTLGLHNDVIDTITVILDRKFGNIDTGLKSAVYYRANGTEVEKALGLPNAKLRQGTTELQFVYLWPKACVVIRFVAKGDQAKEAYAIEMIAPQLPDGSSLTSDEIIKACR